MVLDTVHKQKSFAITLIIMALIVLALLVMRLTNAMVSAEEEEGITITFGTDQVGMGDINPPEPTAPSQDLEDPQEESKIEEQPTANEPLLT